MVVVDLDGKRIEGDLQPSSDTFMAESVETVFVANRRNRLNACAQNPG